MDCLPKDNYYFPCNQHFNSIGIVNHLLRKILGLIDNHQCSHQNLSKTGSKISQLETHPKFFKLAHIIDWNIESIDSVSEKSFWTIWKMQFCQRSPPFCPIFLQCLPSFKTPRLHQTWTKHVTRLRRGRHWICLLLWGRLVVSPIITRLLYIQPVVFSPEFWTINRII